MRRLETIGCPLAVFHALILRQTFETCKPLISGAWRSVSKLTLFETRKAVQSSATCEAERSAEALRPHY